MPLCSHARIIAGYRSQAIIMESRIAELEAKLTLADDQLDQLNRTVFRQQQQIDALQAQLRLVWRQMQSMTSDESRDPREEIPPHY